MVPKPSTGAAIHGPTVPSGHWTRTSALLRRAQPDVGPAELAAAMPATDGQLALLDRRTDAGLEPAPDRVPVRARLHADAAPSSGRAAWSLDPATTPMFRQIRSRFRQVHLDEVEPAVEIEVRQRRPTPAIEVDDARRLGALDERPVGLADQQIAGVAHGEVRLAHHVPLGHEQVDEAVVVHVVELGVPRRRGQVVSPTNGRAALTLRFRPMSP